MYRSFQVERSQEVLKTSFVVTTKKQQQSRAQTDILERNQRRFGKLVFSFW